MDIPVYITKHDTIETERLILRRWKRRDLRDLFEYASVDGVGEMAGWPHHADIDITRHVLRSFRKERNVFAVYHKADNKVIGSLGLHRSWSNDDDAYRHLRCKEIGYVLSRDYWGQGYMTEAVRAVINWCFVELKADALTCGHFTHNDRSRRVIEKCDFRFVRQSEYEARQLGKTYDDARYILMRK